MDLSFQILLSIASGVFGLFFIVLILRLFSSVSRLRNDLNRERLRNEATERDIRALQDIVLQLQDAVSSDNGNDEEFLSKMSRWLENNFSDPDATVDQLALFMGMGRTSLYNRTKNLTGKSPLELIQDYRMKKAASCLKEGKLSIAETACKSGYSDPGYFSRTFRKHFGMSPMEYMKQSGSL